MFDWLAKLLGREVVWLLDFDGEVNKRWARSTPYGLVCWRMFPNCKVTLLPGGVVEGAKFVVSWSRTRITVN